MKNRFDAIWVFEPDIENMTVLKDTFRIKNIHFKNDALSNKNEIATFQDGLGYASKLNKSGNKKVRSITIDSLSDINPTIIKLHIEGDEFNSLTGAKKTIDKNRPIIMVLADHNSDGLCKIAEYLGRLESYTLYFYLHDYCGNSAVYYAIPKTQE